VRIAIASTGRFHVLDLARELRARGHEVRFHAHLPPARAEAYGLPAGAVRDLSMAAAPWLAWRRYAPGMAPALQRRLYFRALNRGVIRKLDPCDVFVCMSGVYLEAAEYARNAFGAKIFLERGSTHVDAQHELIGSDLERLPLAAALSRERELAGYQLADRIMLASRHVVDSFLRDPAAHAKAVMNPYGVDLDRFPLRAYTPPLRRRLLFVGAWSRRKGVDFLIETVRRLPGAVLTHIGAIADMPFPGDDPQFVHVDPVDQARLPGFYHDADVIVMMSREEGLALVQLQALACGLPLVASTRTGAASLVEVDPTLADRVLIHDVGDLGKAVADIEALFGKLAQGALAPIRPEARARLSWGGYGARYERAILEALAK
jgi:glycosyltransferase involved in cell wall biosynthesis